MPKTSKKAMFLDAFFMYTDVYNSEIYCLKRLLFSNFAQHKSSRQQTKIMVYKLVFKGNLSTA